VHVQWFRPKQHELLGLYLACRRATNASQMTRPHDSLRCFAKAIRSTNVEAMFCHKPSSPRVFDKVIVYQFQRCTEVRCISLHSARWSVSGTDHVIGPLICAWSLFLRPIDLIGSSYSNRSDTDEVFPPTSSTVRLNWYVWTLLCAGHSKFQNQWNIAWRSKEYSSANSICCFGLDTPHDEACVHVVSLRTRTKVKYTTPSRSRDYHGPQLRPTPSLLLQTSSDMIYDRQQGVIRYSPKSVETPMDASRKTPRSELPAMHQNIPREPVQGTTEASEANCRTLQSDVSTASPHNNMDRHSLDGLRNYLVRLVLKLFFLSWRYWRQEAHFSICTKTRNNTLCHRNYLSD
jgi:hypothetical protein